MVPGPGSSLVRQAGGDVRLIHPPVSGDIYPSALHDLLGLRIHRWAGIGGRAMASTDRSGTGERAPPLFPCPDGRRQARRIITASRALEPRREVGFCPAGDGPDTHVRSHPVAVLA